MNDQQLTDLISRAYQYDQVPAPDRFHEIYARALLAQAAPSRAAGWRRLARRCARALASETATTVVTLAASAMTTVAAATQNVMLLLPVAPSMVAMMLYRIWAHRTRRFADDLQQDVDWEQVLRAWPSIRRATPGQCAVRPVLTVVGGGEAPPAGARASDEDEFVCLAMQRGEVGEWRLLEETISLLRDRVDADDQDAIERLAVELVRGDWGHGMPARQRRRCAAGS